MNHRLKIRQDIGFPHYVLIWDPCRLAYQIILTRAHRSRRIPHSGYKDQHKLDTRNHVLKDPCVYVVFGGLRGLKRLKLSGFAALFILCFLSFPVSGFGFGIEAKKNRPGMSH